MTTASATPAVIDYLVGAANTAFAGAAVQVFDGVGNTSQDTGQQVWIGAPDMPDVADELYEATTNDVEWPYPGTGFRRERITVHLVFRAWNGGNAMKTVRDQIYSQFQVFAAAFVSDNTLGGNVLFTAEPGTNQRLYQGSNDRGVEARLLVDVTVTAQLQG